MLIHHTLFSHACAQEVTLTLTLPDLPTPDADATPAALLPVLFLLGDTGAESDWWMRHTLLETDISREDTRCATVGVRALPSEQCAALLRELSVLLPALYPLSRERQFVLALGRSAACLPALAGAFKPEALFGEPDAQADALAALGGALRRVTAPAARDKEELS